jgi:threonine aldolase
MRQAGIIASAGIYALSHHVARLCDDHGLARELARRLQEVDGITVANPDVETNIVLFRLEHPRRAASSLLERLELHGVRFSLVGEGRLRAVTHPDVRQDDIGRAVDAVRAVVADA